MPTFLPALALLFCLASAPTTTPTARLIATHEEPTYTRLLLHISAGDHTIPAFLCLPRGATAKVPVVLLIHGAYDDRKETMVYRYASRLAPLGVACLSFDLPGHGERTTDNTNFRTALVPFLLNLAVANNAPLPPSLAGFVNAAPKADPAPVLKGMELALADARTLLDYLETRPELDTTRVGVNGMSLGGTLAASLVRQDDRVKVVLLNVAGAWPAMADQLKATPALAEIWTRLSAPSTRTTSPITLAIAAKADLTCLPDNATALYNAMPDPKELRWIEGGHNISREALTTGALWLARTLDASPLPTTQQSAPSSAK